MLRPFLNRLNLLNGGGAVSRRGYVLDADATFRGPVLDADALGGSYQSWSNDPPSADRVGRYLAGGRNRRTAPKPFSDIFTFTRASAATDFDSTGTLTSLAADAIRQGYDPATLLPAGWLLEGATTNVRTFSADFTNAAYVKIQSSVTPNAGIAPDGTNTLTKLVEAAVNSSHYMTIASPGNVTGNTVYTASIFAKAGERRYLVLSVNPTFNNTGTNLTACIDLLSGAVVASAGTPQVAVVPVGGGVYRCSTTFTTPASVTGGNVIVGCNDIILSVTNNYLGDGVSGLYLWGAQLEANYLASSYIPTTTAAVSRPNDSLTITGNRFTSLFGNGAPQGCVIVDVLLGQGAGSATSQHLCTVSDGTLSQRYTLFNPSSSTAVQGFMSWTGSQSQTAGAGTFTPGTAFRAGLRWTSNGVVSVVLNGGSVFSNSGTPPVGLNQLQLGNSPSLAQPLNGRILRARALAFAPSDADFRALCTPGA